MAGSAAARRARRGARSWRPFLLPAILVLGSPWASSWAQRLSLRDVSLRYEKLAIGGADGFWAGRSMDFVRETFELITSKGYGVEKHTVTTEDGYILGLVRVKGKGKGGGGGRDGAC